MNETSPDARTLAAVLAEEARAGDAHPDLDELVDYHAGRLEPAGEARVRDHLVGCRTCARTLLDLEPLIAAETDDGTVDLGARTSLRELELRLAGTRRPALLYAAAAACLLAIAGLSLWVVDLRRELDRARVNLAVVYLEAEGVRGAEANASELPAGHVWWILRLFPEDPARRLPEYEAVLLDGDGREVRRVPGLILDDDTGVVTLSLPRQWISPSGEYRLELHGLDAGRTLEGAYRLRGPPD